MPLLRCKEAFAVMDGNYPRVLRPGDLVESSDPVVKGREDKFDDVSADSFRPSPGSRTPLVQAVGVIEDATAAPGEKRVRTAPRKAAAKKTTAKKAAAKKA